MMTFLAGFIAYQSYRFVLAFSWGLLLLTLFHAFVLVLTGIEYRKRRNEHDARSLSTPLSRVGR